MDTPGETAGSMAASTAYAFAAMNTSGGTAEDAGGASIDANANSGKVDKAALADAGLSPMILYHDMVLPTNQPLLILTTKRHEILPGFFVHAETPITVESRKLMVLNGCEVLDGRFGNGWRKLPTELKLKILEYDPMLNGNIKRRNKEYNVGDENVLKTLLRYHKMMPELGALATEIFYGSHHFSIESLYVPEWGCDNDNVEKVLFPNPMVNRYIKKLSLSVPLDLLAWSRLQRLANGAWGFKNLKHLTVEVVQTVEHTERDMLSIRSPMGKPESYKPITFQCEGIIIYTLNPVDSWWIPPQEVVRDMNDFLKTKITFAR